MKNQFTTYFQLHLIEFKHHFIIYISLFFYLFLICYFFSEQLIYLFTKKLIQLNLLKYFIFTNITEKIVTNLFIAFSISSFVSLQCLFLQIWSFCSKGFYKYENVKILKYLLLISLFNYFIIQFILLQIIPNIWFFFVTFPSTNTYLFNIFFEPKLNNYFEFVLYSFISIYCLFLYFYFILFLLFKTILKLQNIIQLRKLFYFKFIIFSIFISPPEIVTQLIIYVSFVFIFEISIFIYIFIQPYVKP